MAYLDKSALLGSNTLKVEDVPFGDGMVRIRELSSAKKLTIGENARDGKHGENAAMLIAGGLINEEGATLLTLPEARRFLDNHGEQAETLLEAIAKLSGLDEEAAERAKKKSEKKTESSSSD